MTLTEYRSVDQQDVLAAMHEQFPEMVVQMADGNSFFFATLVQSDTYDTMSQLSRPGVYRLNIGVGKLRLSELLDEAGAFDFTALDTLMPHPTYASAGWVCILNPSAATFETVRALLTLAYGRSEKRVTINTPDS